MDKVIVAVTGRAQGIKGELKINLISGNVARFSGYSKVNIDNTVYESEYVKELPNGIFAKFKGVNDRNAAEKLVNKEISVGRDEIGIDDDEYFISDLIGCEIISDGRNIGTLKEVLQNGAADVYVVDGERPFMFPALKKVLARVDVESRVIELNGEALKEIILYEE